MLRNDDEEASPAGNHIAVARENVVPLRPRHRSSVLAERTESPLEVAPNNPRYRARGWMGLGLAEIFYTPDILAERVSSTFVIGSATISRTGSA